MLTVKDLEEALKEAQKKYDNAVKRLEELAGDMKTCGEDGATIDAIFKRIQKIQADVEETTPQVQAFLKQDDELNALARKHSDLFETIYNASKDVDASKTAKEFASKLLYIVRMAFTSTYLRQLVENDAETLEETMKEIAEGK